MKNDKLKKRSMVIALISAVLVLTTSLSQCHNEPEDKLLETIDNGDELGSGHQQGSDGSLSANKQNTSNHSYDYDVDDYEPIKEESKTDAVKNSSTESTTSNGISSSDSKKTDNKKKDDKKKDDSNKDSASGLASLIDNIINPKKENSASTGSGSESVFKKETNDSSSKGSGTSNKGTANSSSSISNSSSNSSTNNSNSSHSSTNNSNSNNSSSNNSNSNNSSSNNSGSNNSSSNNSSNNGSSNNNDDSGLFHIHIWGGWQDNGANEIRYCLLNNSHTQTRDHSYGSYTYNPATGKDEAKCKQCGHIDQRMHLHIMGDYVYNPATGKDEATCSACGHKESRPHVHNWGPWEDNGSNEIRRCTIDSRHTETRAHTYGSYTYNPATGKDEATCTTCGHVDQKAHTHIMGGYVYNPATGLEESTCSACGHKETRPHTHTWGPWQDNGTNEIRRCTVDSSHTETRAHSMGEYVYNPTTGLEEATCSTCGHKETRAHTHSYGAEQEEIVNSGSVCYKTYHVCSACGHREYTGEYGHTMGEYVYNPSSGLEESTCSKCGHTETRAHTHNWVNGTEEIAGDSTVCYKEYRECSICHTKEYLVDHDHEFSEWTNAGDHEQRVCTHNGAHIETRDHSWGEYSNVDSSTDRRTCNTCGATEDRAHTHVFGGGSNKEYKYESDVCYVDVQTCDECGANVEVESHPHVWVTEVVAGQEIEVCGECGTPRADLEARIDIYDIMKDVLKTLKYKEVFFDNSLLCDNKSRVLRKEKNKERV